ncbi:DNA polymerase, partial [Paramuricea clavata]
MQDLKQRTLEKIQFLKDNGYNVVQIWTCDIERQLPTEPEMKDFFDNFEIFEPLEPRHAFFGGRTNAFTTTSSQKRRSATWILQPLPMLATFNSNVLVVNLVKQFLGVTNTASILLAIPRLLLRTFNLSVTTLASGFPPECDTDEKKEQYIADYATKEGIQLDPRQIVKNPGLRALAKLMLNSFG